MEYTIFNLVAIIGVIFALVTLALGFICEKIGWDNVARIVYRICSFSLPVLMLVAFILTQILSPDIPNIWILTESYAVLAMTIWYIITFFAADRGR